MKENWTVDGRSSVFQIHGDDRDVKRSQKLCEQREGDQRVMAREEMILLRGQWGYVKHRMRDTGLAKGALTIVWASQQ